MNLDDYEIAKNAANERGIPVSKLLHDLLAELDQHAELSTPKHLRRHRKPGMTL